ncbi:uncharacterized protein LOC119097313 [Pollicipes pollicipes]|uniref:uncharacterized protein LOC119097313 n=1 Tax=Pollicipes pollicipes TaxID=41117 RepID=UPI001884B1E9|nr:uncharacterized protein LOC119097313 [Pollicipes pollicipes]
MTAVSARRRLLALTVITLLGCSGSAQAEVIGCRPPGANTLSRVVFSEPPQPSAAPPSGQPARQSEGLYLPGPQAADASGRLPSGTWARYSCDPGYLMIGDPVRTCLPEGQWTGSAPHCYLNAAEHSSLATQHSNLADGDLSTSDDLLALFEGGRSLFVDLFFVYPLLEMRIITFYNLTGMNIQIRLSDDNISWIGISMSVEAPQQSERRQQGLAVHTISLQNTVLQGGARFVKVSLFHSSGNYFRRASYSPVWPLHELQIVAESTGLSKHQCLDDVGRPNIAETWAADGRCYHLVSSRLTQQLAEDECHRLGSEGTLMRDSSAGLHDMVIDILRHRRKSKLTRVSDIWTAGKADDMHDSGAESVTYGAGRPGGCPRAAAPPRLGCRPCALQRPLQVHLSERYGPGPRSAPRQCPQVDSAAFLRRPAGNNACDEYVSRWSDYLGAIIGGVVGGAVVLAVLAVLLVCNARRRDDKLASEPYNFMEFWGLNHNPIYKSDEEEHVYSEVGGGEAIYEEPSFSASYRKPLPVEPPPLPGSHPSVSTMETDVTVSLAQDESDYEVFSTLDASKPIAKDLSATNSTGEPTPLGSEAGECPYTLPYDPKADEVADDAEGAQEHPLTWP